MQLGSTAPVQTYAPVFEPVWNTLILRTPAAAVFGHYLYAIVAPAIPTVRPDDFSDNFYLAANRQCEFGELNADGTLPLPLAGASSLWDTSTYLAVNEQYTDLDAWGGVSAAVVGDYLCIFWQDDKGLMFTQLGSDVNLSQPNAWKPWCQLTYRRKHAADSKRCRRERSDARQ